MDARRKIELGWLAELPAARGAPAEDLLARVFVACHPVLPRDAREVLALHLAGGLSAAEIAETFLVPPVAIEQRIAGAGRILVAARVPFAVPGPDEFPGRLAVVLDVVYGIFTEGYAATIGKRWIRRHLADEALRLGGVLAELLPGEGELQGLVALMELNASRFPARIGPNGEHVLLPQQDRSRWDRALITNGLARLDRARQPRERLGPYGIQAAIAACHARAGRFEDTDWDAIVVLYDALARLTPSPVVELNRAVALLHADGPAAALRALDAVREDPWLARYHLFGAARGDVLLRLGRHREAAEELERAAGLAPTQRERTLLMERAAAAAGGS
jgi:predicted RNA polymerase sigma factor